MSSERKDDRVGSHVAAIEPWRRRLRNAIVDHMFKCRTPFTGTYSQGKPKQPASLGRFPACLPPSTTTSLPDLQTTHVGGIHPLALKPDFTKEYKHISHHVRTKRIRHPHLLRRLLLHRPTLLSLHQWRDQAHA